MNKLNILSKALRKRPTEVEKFLWNKLRAKQMEGFKFRRQQPIDNRVIIEVDGGQHVIEKEYDVERDNYLKRHGFKVLRFWSNEVLQNIGGVLEIIR